MVNHEKHLEFGIESLEDRKMMAGDVDIDLTGGGRLYLDGDNQANEISMTQLVGTNTLRIAGSNGTTVTYNGVTSNFVDVTHEKWNDIRINMNGGDDAVIMLNVDLEARNGSDLKIDMGSGEDRLFLQDVEMRRNIQIDMGDGNDFEHVILNRVEAGRDLLVDTDGGDDQVSMTNAFSERRTRVRTRDGADNVDMYNADTNDLRVDMGDGDDSLRIRGTAANNVDLDGGDDVDTLIIENNGIYANEFDTFAESDDFEVFVD